jgi:glycosyltransferase involved in cell wall biosynthesis
MRIAYIAPYQGPTLVKRRPIVRNRSLSNRIKIELIATLLQDRTHEVELISQGEVIEPAYKFYPSFSEPERFHAHIPIYYGSALPIRRLNGLWSNTRTLHILKERHRAKPYDLVIIFNLKDPQIACADYAIRRLGLPVILEYEDDRFVNVQGEVVDGFASRLTARAATRLLQSVSGCMAVSPHLLSQVPSGIPTLLLRGVVGDDVVKVNEELHRTKQNVVLFSGTHIRSNGVAELIEGWRSVGQTDWELHITGYGELTDSLRRMTEGVPGITFHGLVSRPELVQLMCSAKICINPHQVSQTPGNVFAFKLIEYLATGAHVITTPMGSLEKELEAGITYMPDNSPGTIAATIQQVIKEREYERNAMKAAQQTYGPAACSKSLDDLLNRVMDMLTKHNRVSRSMVLPITSPRKGSSGPA